MMPVTLDLPGDGLRPGEDVTLELLVHGSVPGQGDLRFLCVYQVCLSGILESASGPVLIMARSTGGGRRLVFLVDGLSPARDRPGARGLCQPPAECCADRPPPRLNGGALALLSFF